MEFGVGRAATAIHDDVLKGLGRVAVSFGLLELSLASLMDDLIGTDIMVSRAIVSALAFRRRIDVLVSLVSIRAPLFSRADLNTLANRLTDAEDRRNRAFHSIFLAAGPTGTPVQYKDKVSRDGYRISTKDVDPRVINADADFIAEVAADVTRAGGEIIPLVGKLPSA